MVDIVDATTDSHGTIFNTLSDFVSCSSSTLSPRWSPSPLLPVCSQGHASSIPAPESPSTFLKTSDETSPPPLPQSFFSLYRLILRSTAASVLAQPQATSLLRKQWRPVFSQAGLVMRQLQDNDLPPERRDALMHWLQEWNRRMDNTLSLLYSSAVARGLPHQVTRNLSKLTPANRDLIDPPSFMLDGGNWEGQLAEDHAKYKPARAVPRKAKSDKQRDREQLSQMSLYAVSDLVRMAEGWGGVSLGRLRRRGSR